MAVCLRKRKVRKRAKHCAKKLEFRIRDGLIIPYIEPFKGMKKSLPITSIIIGPHPYQDKQEEALKLLLETLDLDIGVRRSGIPYRT